MMRDITDTAYRIAVNIAPKKSKNLALNGISRRVYEDVGEVNYDNVKYINALENGSKPHIIKATSAKSLAFQVGGNLVFAKQVKHPGSKKHKDFIKTKTVNAIKEMVYAKANGQFDSQAFDSTYQELDNFKPTTETYATYLQNIGGESLE
jgi:hypothetical protein